ncbi:MAG: hypothetical protein B6226_04135 [Candidatus Cloacimonetes bacterium 4572_65]|nr:MAG: hypothetical protein B6226_04135 [Candidatus Cloacimonetes bacterium 4572_65]
MYKIILEQKERVSKNRELVYNIIAIIVALIISGIVLAMNGYNPFSAFAGMFQTTFGSTFGLTETVVKTIPLIFTGLSVAIALNSKVWNVGAEGQLYIGALWASWFALYMPTMPKIIGIPLILIASMMGGAIWAFIPALLKMKFKMNEVISTLLMNYVAISILNYFVYGPMKRSDNFPYSEDFPKEAIFSKIGSSNIHIGLIFAIALVLILFYVLKYTKFGYELRVIGSSIKAAKYAGINYEKTMLFVFLLSGAFAGLAGANQVCGIEHKLHTHISDSLGYTGIIVAWLARSNPFIIVGFAFFMSSLLIGSESLQYEGIPVSIGKLMQSFILFSILGSELFKNYKIKIKRR